MSRCFNFSAGPSELPLEVLEQVRDELLDFRGTGCSIMEISHRSKAFTEVHNETQQMLRSLLDIPEEYDILFMQGGGHMQFSMVPLNLMAPVSADPSRRGGGCYIVNGTWSRKAALRPDGSAVFRSRLKGMKPTCLSSRISGFRRTPPMFTTALTRLSTGLSSTMFPIRDGCRLLLICRATS